MRTALLALLLVGCASVPAATPVTAPIVAASAETDPVDTITVTGSRLRGGDQTNRLIVIDEKEIRDRGVQTVEELIRTLPENVATIGAITNDRSKGPLSSAAGNSGARVISDVWLSNLVAWLTRRSSATDVANRLELTVELLLGDGTRKPE